MAVTITKPISCVSMGCIIWNAEHSIDNPFGTGQNISLRDLGLTINRTTPFKFSYFNDVSLYDPFHSNYTDHDIMLWDPIDYREQFITIDSCTLWSCKFTTDFYTEEDFYFNSSIGNYTVPGLPDHGWGIEKMKGGNGSYGIKKYNNIVLHDSSIYLHYAFKWGVGDEEIQYHAQYIISLNYNDASLSVIPSTQAWTAAGEKNYDVSTNTVWYYKSRNNNNFYCSAITATVWQELGDHLQDKYGGPGTITISNDGAPGTYSTTFTFGYLIKSSYNILDVENTRTFTANMTS